MLSPDEALDQIRDLLDGQEWDAETLNHVAEIVRETGREIRDLLLDEEEC